VAEIMELVAIAEKAAVRQAASGGNQRR